MVEMRTLAKVLAVLVWRLIGRVIPKRADYVVLSTYPDFDDTFSALQAVTQETGKTLIVLTRRHHVPPSGALAAQTKIASAKSLRGVWYYHRARTALFTHGLFSGWAPSDRQLVINLWHGTPIKNIGRLDGKDPSEVPQSHFVLAESVDYQAIMADVFGVPVERILVAAHPRIDMLASEKRLQIAPKHKGKTLVAWLPTYRKSVTGDVRQDGSPDKDILSDQFDVARLDRIFAKHNAICIVKPHPMAVYAADQFQQTDNIILLENGDLAAQNLTVYEFLANADMLITDLSSVLFDFRFTGKPALVFFPDRQEYAETRGFVRPLEDVLTDGCAESLDDFETEFAVKIEQATGASTKAMKGRNSQTFLALVDQLHQSRFGR